MASKPVSIDLGDMAGYAEQYVHEGAFGSLDEVVQEGLRALDRERSAFDAVLKVKIQEAFDDPRPSLSVEEAFAEIRRNAAARRS